jgi:hypothetical protein
MSMKLELVLATVNEQLLQCQNGWVDDAALDVSRPIRLKSSDQTFSGTKFVPRKTCVLMVVIGASHANVGEMT